MEVGQHSDLIQSLVASASEEKEDDNKNSPPLLFEIGECFMLQRKFVSVLLIKSEVVKIVSFCEIYIGCYQPLVSRKLRMFPQHLVQGYNAKT